MGRHGEVSSTYGQGSRSYEIFAQKIFPFPLYPLRSLGRMSDETVVDVLDLVLRNKLELASVLLFYVCFVSLIPQKGSIELNEIQKIQQNKK